MSSLATAVIGSAVIGGIASSRGARKAAGATRDATAMQVEEQRRQYDQTREDFAPWREQGMWAMDMLRDPTKNFYASPDYEFRRSEGLRDIGNQFAAKGGGGNAMKALAGYSSGLAGGEFGNWFNRMFGMSEAGRGAQGTVAHAGMNAANAISGAYGNQGRQLGNIYSNKYANINNALNSGISNLLYMNQAGIGPWRG